MTSAMLGPLGIPMARMASGTAWMPERAPLPSREFTAGAWMLMVHGAAWGQYDWQGGPRGNTQWGGLNWGMLMGSRALAGGRLTLRGMFSLDALTVGECGYPLLLQTGESCNGSALVDRQHPHDAYMDVSAMYERAVASNLAVLVYGAPVGEPALGPVAFMHRASASHDPFAPIGHHWQDATHVTFGVLTTGIFTRNVRLEASAFNGREPDENRWNVDPIRFDSYSTRATFDPTPAWSFTGGYGFVHSPEASRPQESMHRIVASALFGTQLDGARSVAVTAVFGENIMGAGSAPSHSFLLEGDADVDTLSAIFGRAEFVQKSAEDLSLAGFGANYVFDVSTVGVGYERTLMHGLGSTIGVGAMGTVNIVPPSLASLYGSRTPLGFTMFLRIAPARGPASEMHGMEMPGMDPLASRGGR